MLSLGSWVCRITVSPRLVFILPNMDYLFCSEKHCHLVFLHAHPSNLFFCLLLGRKKANNFCYGS